MLFLAVRDTLCHKLSGPFDSVQILIVFTLKNNKQDVLKTCQVKRREGARGKLFQWISIHLQPIQLHLIVVSMALLADTHY